MRFLKPLFLFTDLGFIAYWLVTVFQVVPTRYLYNDYHNPLLVAWNWSFLPLDMLVSASGLTSLVLQRRNNSQWIQLALVSLVLTSCSGLQALAFWAIRGDFEPTWWLANAFLLIYPLFLIPRCMQAARVAFTASPSARTHRCRNQ